MTDEQIIDLFGSVPYFVDTQIASIEPEKVKYPFKIFESWCAQGSVNIQRVCGTMHPDYAGLTWRELLKKGCKMESNIRLYQKHPEYYLSLQYLREPSLYFCFYDGKGYIAEDGNHRACIARFFLYSQKSPFLHGVHINEIQTDIYLMNLFQKMKKVLPEFCILTPLSKEISRDDGDGWATHHFKNTILIENRRRRGFSGEFSADEIAEGLLPEFFNPVKRRFGSYRKLFN